MCGSLPAGQRGNMPCTFFLSCWFVRLWMVRKQIASLEQLSGMFLLVRCHGGRSDSYALFAFFLRDSFSKVLKYFQQKWSRIICHFLSRSQTSHITVMKRELMFVNEVIIATKLVFRGNCPNVLKKSSCFFPGSTPISPFPSYLRAAPWGIFICLLYCWQ